MSKSKSKNKSPFVIGNKYFIRSVTFHNVGRVKDIVGGFVILENASWIADSGRFNEMLQTGEFNEVEPFKNDVFVNIAGIVDATLFEHELPDGPK